VGKVSAELLGPEPHGLVRGDDAKNCQHILDHPQAERKTEITAVSGSATTTRTQVDRSLSIASEPDNKWVAARQSIIDADQVALKQANAELRADIARFSGEADDEMEVSPEG
jgi:hypothetical protein